LLVLNGARYDIFDLGGSSAVHYAVDSANCELIEWLIKDGCDVNMRDRNIRWTPLIRCASLHGNKLVALTLILNGADTDIRDSDGKTCLMVAVVNNHQAMVDVLLDNNANITLTNS
ncbi:hypothetical protein Ahia01_000669800, partial [Argonauta hians]